MSNYDQLHIGFKNLTTATTTTTTTTMTRSQRMMIIEILKQTRNKWNEESVPLPSICMLHYPFLCLTFRNVVGRHQSCRHEATAMSHIASSRNQSYLCDFVVAIRDAPKFG